MADDDIPDEDSDEGASTDDVSLKPNENADPQEIVDSKVPKSIREKYEVFSYRNAAVILAEARQQQFAEIVAALEAFTITTEMIRTAGGNESDIGQLNEHARAKEGIGSGLKTYQANFLESNLVAVSKLPVSAQRRIHEIRNQLSILNQDISKAENYMMMTFNSSLSEVNHKTITDDLKGTYVRVQKRAKNLADSIEAVLSEL